MSRPHIILPALVAGLALVCALALMTAGARTDPPLPDAPVVPQPVVAPPLLPLTDLGEIKPPQVEWRRSRAFGAPWSGRLARGVQLPYEGATWFTWDPVRNTVPNRAWRRWGTDRLVRVLLRVLRGYAAAHPHAARVGVGDLSRRHGGNFGRRFGGIGHASHQNGLDVDVYYPRRDGREREPRRVGQIDRRLAQDLVRRFVAAGAEKVFVGPRTGLRGKRGVVSALTHHDNHLHVRIRNR